MKILHVINNLEIGGAQSLLVELAPVQKEMGHIITVLELRKSKDRTFSDKLEERGVQVEYLSETSSVRSPLNILRLIHYFKQFDIVHAHLFPANYWVALAKLICKSKTPIITTEHSTTNKRRTIPVFKYIDNFIYNQYCEVVACSDRALETFKQRYSEIRSVAIPNGVDVSRFMSAEPYLKKEVFGISEDSFVVTMVARFDYPKRQDTLVHALTELPEKCHVVFIGGTSDHPALNRIIDLAKDLGVDSRTHFLYSRSDVPRLLKSSDVVVMSSEYEGLSLSSIEGMASARPFVATDVNGLREIVKGAGLLFQLTDSHQLAEIITKLWFDKSFYNNVANKCLDRSAEYDIHTVSKMYEEEYEKFIKEKYE